MGVRKEREEAVRSGEVGAGGGGGRGWGRGSLERFFEGAWNSKRG